MAVVLDGIRVVDMTVFYQGPVACRYLADFGAEVIKVEPLEGEVARGLQQHGILPMKEWNSYYYNNNRNRKSLAINLTKEEGKQIVYKLVEKSDVFVSNYRFTGLQRLKMDYQTLYQVNPRLIYAASTGFGYYGPDRDKAAFDPIAEARVGIMSYLGEEGQPPVYPGWGAGDMMGAILTSLGIVLALYHRQKSGDGQRVAASLFGGCIFAAAPFLQPYLSTSRQDLLHQPSRKARRNPLCNVYPTKDKWCYFYVPNSQKFWSKFCQALGMKELEDDPRFNTSENRSDNSSQLISILDSVLTTKSAVEWVKRYHEEGLLIMPVNSFEDLSRDPGAWENQYLVEIDDPRWERRKTTGLVAQLSKTPGETGIFGPELGQHNEEILIDLLGYTWDQIVSLKDEGVIL